MQFKFCLNLIGNQTAIQEFHRLTAVPGATAKAGQRKAVWPPVENAEVSWIWRTEYKVAQSDFPEDDIAPFLRSYKPLIPYIDQYRSQLLWTSLAIAVTQEKTESPRGFYFSRETIALIQEFGLDLDIDFMEI